MFYKFYKKIGDFSNKTIRQIAKEVNADKIGHIGILDPLAEGLMIFATNEDTKLFEYIKNDNKTYIASAKFFQSSDTLDITGNVISHDKKVITQEKLDEAISWAKSLKEQIPPIYSAKKINGKKAYEYARNGEEVKMRTQKITIHDIELLEFNGEDFLIKTTVSSGTYIRTLLVDIAKFLGTTCVMTKLKRSSVGQVELGNLEPDQYSLINNNELFDIETYEANQKELAELSFGRKIYIKTNDKTLFIINPITKEICSVGKVEKNYFYPKKVFNKRLQWKN
ncbi:tRNA pseudouridine(55) synthase TruB [Mycoplasmopsis edwardii]|uniref:tRNA pseudouridine(55) synthase TruB n=1 Tax=Mycoplasmopsis edwardii TaxID=53558 RepID=A0ACD4PHY2_9BACT|nr:tRNA pseudouridine(55) synthase TruB [Mycoplasmopsis edwardii]WBP84207.1 tRNA pseudouridine(55) synthase TruB [Mycoplasmopsis edwardii]